MSGTSRRFALAVLALWSATPVAWAAKVGLGAQVNINGGYTVLVPIQASETLLLEPEFSYYKTRDEYSEVNSSVRSALDTDDYKRVALGIGVYRQFALREHSRAFAGARISVFRSVFKNTDDQTGDTVEFENNGVMLAPTLGLQYQPDEQFSLSVDVAISYQRIFGDSDSSSNLITTIESDAYRLSTPVRIIARFFF